MDNKAHRTIITFVSSPILTRFRLANLQAFAYNWHENEREDLPALRKAPEQTPGGSRPGILFQGTPQPVSLTPWHGPPGGSEQGGQPDAPPGKPASDHVLEPDVPVGDYSSRILRLRTDSDSHLAVHAPDGIRRLRRAAHH